MHEPVVIAEYDVRWPERYAAEADAIREALGDEAVAVEHVGSSAVEGLAAKPIVDVLVGLHGDAPGKRAVERIEALGYEARGEAGIPGRSYFRKGRPRRFHMHMVRWGSTFWREQLLFRDYLRAHGERRDAYAALKRHLADRHRADRAAYTEAKAGFVAETLALARQWVRMTAAAGGATALVRAATPFGDASGLWGPHGLVLVTTGSPDEAEFWERIGAHADAPATVPVDAARQAAFAYDLSGLFYGEQPLIPLDLAGMTPFQRRVIAAAQAVQFGHTASYADVALAAGHPRAHRAAGSALAQQPFAFYVPAQRVVRRDGLPSECRFERSGLRRRMLEWEQAIARRSAG
ncbi:MAG TPA: methylated-DNA--[protein]-cysteine S-methyltransferase [Limnochordia bacterium]|nr:methylated-DNA--[protein]-cysteine S-methyltransferase [Limnochordia bacterium]